MLNAKISRWGRPLLFVGLAIWMLGFLFRVRHWPYGQEILLVGQVVTAVGLFILVVRLFDLKK